MSVPSTILFSGNQLVNKTYKSCALIELKFQWRVVNMDSKETMKEKSKIISDRDKCYEKNHILDPYC